MVSWLRTREKARESEEKRREEEEEKTLSSSFVLPSFSFLAHTFQLPTFFKPKFHK